MQAPWLRGALLALGIYSLSAGTVTFDDLTPGSVVDGDYGDFRIESFERVVDITTGQLIHEGRAQIQYFFGSLAVVAHLDSAGLYYDVADNPRNRIQLGVNFDVAVSSFAFDISSFVYSTGVTHFGRDAAGNYFEQRTSYPFGLADSVLRATATAPAGGRIDGFFFTQTDQGGVELRMDNFSYATVPDGGMTASLLVISFLGLRFVRKKAAVPSEARASL